MTQQLPLSVNAMNDETLTQFVLSPKGYLTEAGVDVSRADVDVAPSPFTPETRLRIEQILVNDGRLTPADIARQIDRYARLKVTKIVIDI